MQMLNVVSCKQCVYFAFIRPLQTNFFYVQWKIIHPFMRKFSSNLHLFWKCTEKCLKELFITTDSTNLTTFHTKNVQGRLDGTYVYIFCIFLYIYFLVCDKLMVCHYAYEMDQRPLISNLGYILCKLWFFHWTALH